MWNAVADRTNLAPKKHLYFWIAPIVLVIMLAGCTSVKPVVKIGLVGPFEGKNRQIGYDVIYSARMAVREANLSGGVGDYRIALVALDDFGDPETAAAAAESLVIDESVAAVIGHWLPGTSRAAVDIYRQNNLPIIVAGEDPFGPIDPQLLPQEFIKAYGDITPFDEEAGPYAAAGYDALNLAVAALELAQREDGIIRRERVGEILSELVYDGITGPVSAP